MSARASHLGWAASLLVLAGCGEPPAVNVPDAAMPLDFDVPLRPHPDLAGAIDDYDMTPVPGPARLSQSGLYSDFAKRTLSPGVIAYEVRYPLWSDGADKARYLRLPPGTKIDTSDMDNWRFPVGTRTWKEFRRDGKLVETRLLLKVADEPGGWYAMAFLWQRDGSDALAVPDGVDNALGTPHRVPPQIDCWQCHGGVSDVIIGVSAIQLSQGDGKGPLMKLAAMGLLSHPPKGEFEVPGSGTAKAAVGYLHGNCGNCHNSRAPVLNESDMRLRVYVVDKVLAESDPYRTAIGLKTFHVGPTGTRFRIIAGKPEQSQMWERMGYRDDWQMPPYGSKVVDTTGRALIASWIRSL